MAGRNHEERHPNSYIVVSSKAVSPNCSQHPSPAKFTGNLSGNDATPQSSASIDLESDQSPNQAGKMSRSIPARRKLCMAADTRDEESDGREEYKSKAPVPILVDDDELVTIADREAISDIGDSEIECVARRYIIQTLNRTLMELYHACEVDCNLERCDHALSILQEATRSFLLLRERMANQGQHECASAYANEPSSGGALCSDSFQSQTSSTPFEKGESPIVTWCDVVRRHSKAENFEVVCREPASERSLHEKLLSPDRHRRNPESVMKKHDEKQELAKRKREELESQKQERLREADQQRQEKLRQLKEKRETDKISIDERLKRAHELYQMRLMERQQKAGKESTKVSEVKQEIAFIDQLTAENKNIDLQTRMEMAEARRLQALETAAKAAERNTREASARQRRAAMEGAKMERIHARQAQKFGTAGEFLESAELVQSVRDDPRTTTMREEAARMRREQLDQERQRKVEQVAHEKELRAEEHQRKILEERMKVLAAKEARLRHQGQLLDRMAKAMQADAQAQRDCLQHRLDAVLNRKERYLAHISKVHGDKSMSMHHYPENIAEDFLNCVEQETKETGSDEKLNKSRRKRAKKFRQRLAGIRNAWQEKEDDSSSRPSTLSVRSAKLARLFSDVVKGAPASDQEVPVGKSKGRSWPQQPCRDLDGMLRILQEIHRFTRIEDADSKTVTPKSERDVNDTVIRKSGCLSALIRLLCSDAKFMFPKLHVATLRVLVDVLWNDSVNRVYIIVTCRLLSLIDLLETALCTFSDLDVENDNFNVVRLLIVGISMCLDCQCDTVAQVQARDDTLGYLVHTEVVFRLEKLLIDVIRLVANLCSSKKIECVDNITVLRLSGFMNFLVSAFSLIESMTKCQESSGQVRCSVKDELVIASLSSVLREARLVGLVPLLSALLLEINLCSSTTADLCKEGEQPLSPQGKSIGLRCIAKSLKILNNIAILDRELVQNYLGSVVVCSEFSHIVLKILELFRSNQTNVVCEILHETILLLGFLAYSTAPGSYSPFTGWRNGVRMLQEICELPVSFFISPVLREIIFPTLIVATFKNNALLAAVANVVSPCLLSTYLKHCIKCSQNHGIDPRISFSDGLSRQWSCVPPAIAPKFFLANRFPAKNWVEASDWFSAWISQASVPCAELLAVDT